MSENTNTNSQSSEVSTSTTTNTSVPTNTAPTGTEIVNNTQVSTSTEQKPTTNTNPTAESENISANKNIYQSMIDAYNSGEIEEADYEAIEKTGLSREAFEVMAEGFKARRANREREIFESAGGPENYQRIREYITSSMSKSEIETFNAALSAKDSNIAKMAVLGAKAMFESVHGNKPQTRIQADGSVTSSVEAFSNQQELIKAMNNRKYKTDAAYRAEVHARRLKSGF